MYISPSTVRRLAFATTFLLGMGLGAGLTIQLLEDEYNENIDREVAKARRYFDKLHKRGEYDDPIALVEAKGLEIVEAKITAEEYVTTEAVVAEVGTKSVFNDPRPVDIGEEIVRPDPLRPYVLTADEFYSNVEEWEEDNLNYYEFDGVLTDKNDNELLESDDIVGDDNLLKFGHGSNDPNVVYIRNPKKRIQYEVIRTKGSYGEIVHGILQHGDRKRKPKKFRRDDE